MFPTPFLKAFGTTPWWVVTVLVALVVILGILNFKARKMWSPHVGALLSLSWFILLVVSIVKWTWMMAVTYALGSFVLGGLLAFIVPASQSPDY